MEIRIYPSSIDPKLRLSAEFHVPEKPKPLCLFFHGWHMTAAGSSRGGHIAKLARGFFVVNVDMRGRGESTGAPDASGHELIDGLDALDFARTAWPEAVQEDAGPYVIGGSGGGGNTLALAGKAPDLFAAAVAWAGMSDYALWYEDDGKGRYRDEMERKGWIGGSPATNPESYRSRSGLCVLGNVTSPVLVIHGRRDEAVPVHHAERYKTRAEQLRKSNVELHLNDAGHDSIEWPRVLAFLERHGRPPRLPNSGTLLVHSFVACRSFWLVLDRPSRLGKVDYELDTGGYVRSLRFSQDEGRAPVEEVLLRVIGPVKRIDVRMAGATFSPAAVFRHGRHSDYRWECSGSWEAEIAR